MLMWPQKIASKDIDKKFESERIDFDEFQVPQNPVVVTFYNTGHSSGSSEGFLYLSYLLASKGDLQGALSYLQKGAEARLKHSGSTLLLERFEEMFRTMPWDSVDARVLKLKAVLQLNQIKRQQTRAPLFKGKDSKEQGERFIEQAHYIERLLDVNTMLPSPESKTEPKSKADTIIPSWLFEPEVRSDSLVRYRVPKLTAEELEELRSLQHEVPPLPAESPEEVIVQRPSVADLTSLFPHLLVEMGSFPKGDPILQLGPLNADKLMKNFFYILNHVCEKDLKPKDLAMLFAPIPNMDKHVETARGALLALAASDSKIPLEIKALKNLLPRSLLDEIASVFKLNQSSQQFAEQLAKLASIGAGPGIIRLAPETTTQKTPEKKSALSEDELKKICQKALIQKIHDLEVRLEKQKGKPTVAAGWQPLDEAIRETDAKDILKTAETLIEISSMFEERRIKREGVKERVVCLLPLEKLDEMKGQIKKGKLDMLELAERARQRIFDQLGETFDQLPEKLCVAIANEKAVGRQAVIDVLLDEYQTDSLESPLAADVTAYLMFQTAWQQLEIAENDHLAALFELKAEEPSDPEKIDHDFWEREWLSASAGLLNTLQAGLNVERYLENGQLSSPRFTRKFLVTEVRTRMILRSEQQKLVYNITTNPNAWYELRMGLGKTSMIMPIVLLLFAEEGKFPVALVKEELLRKNVDDFDTSTRLMMQKAGIDFEFSIASSMDLLVLLENYYRLLKVKEDNGYVITTVSTLASIDHRLSLMAMNPGDDQEQILVLTKIRSLLTGKNNPLGFPTQLFGDEVDALFSVVQENNLAVPGSPIGLDPTVREMMNEILEKIMTAETGDLHTLRSALETSEQAAIAREVKEKVYKELARSFFPEFRDILQCTELLFVDYICEAAKNGESKFADLSAKIEQAPDEVKQRLGALKHFMQITLPNALSLENHIDAGYKESKDFFLVGPQVSGQESEGMLFSDIFDVVANHMIFYSHHLPDDEFVNQSIKTLRELHPGQYLQWKGAADEKGISVLDYLNLQVNWRDRIAFFNLVLIDGLLIKRFKEQFLMNVQETVHEGNIGGATGTKDSFQLPVTGAMQAGNAPTYFSSDQIVNKSEVEEETKERINRISPTVAYADENEMVLKMENCLKDFTCKAIINEGCPFGGKNSYEVVKSLRQSEHGQQRYFIFTDPKSRKTLFWEPGAPAPRTVTTLELNELLRDRKIKRACFFYFGPPDTRGTDYRIPAGHALMFVGVKTTKSSFQQGVWRLRGLGERHTVNFVAPKVVEKRIEGTHQSDFDRLYSDIEKTTAQAEEGLRLKAAFQKVTSIVTTGIRNMIFDPTFWKGRKRDREICEKLFESVRHILIQARTVNLEAESAVTTMRSLEEAIGLLFEKQQGKVELVRQKMGANGLLAERDTKCLDAILSSLGTAQEQLDAFVRANPKHLRESVPSLGDGVTNSQEHVQEQSLEKGLEQAIEQAQQNENEIALTVGGDAVEYWYDSFWDPLTELTAKPNAFPKGTIDDVLRRKMLTQEFPRLAPRQLHVDFPDEIATDPRRVWSLYRLPERYITESPFQFNRFNPQLGSMSEGLEISQQMRDCYDQLPKVSGASLGHFLVYGDRVILISQTDYVLKIAPFLKDYSFQTREFEVVEPIAVYSVLNGARSSKGVEVKMGWHHTPDVEGNPILRERIARMKFLLGFSEFSGQELADLQNALIKLSPAELDALQNFIKIKGSSRQAELLKQIFP